MSESKIRCAYQGHSTRLPDDIQFRAINAQDMGFLQDLYASTREDEIAQAGWSEEKVQEFMAMQFNAQHTHYMEHFAGSEFLVVLKGEERIGRVYLERRSDEIRLIDIALIKSQRGNGLGTQLLRDLMDEVADRRQALRIHVEQFNPAMRLYKRLGFKKLEEYGIYDLMEWLPQVAE